MSSTPRFFVPPDAITDGVVTLPADAAHHARAVLRLRAGERVLVCPGDGSALDCTLTHLTPGEVAAVVTGQTLLDTEPRTRIVVVQALPRNLNKLEQVLQHGTEVGAAGFRVFRSARSIARLEPEKVEQRLLRWRGIVRGAAEQSGRGLLPEVSWDASLPEATRAIEHQDAVLLLHESAPRSLSDALADIPETATRFAIVVGPEGGFAEEEVAEGIARGGKAISLGPRILRTETAALVALAQILFARETQ